MNDLGEREFRLGGWVVSPKLNCLSTNGKTIRVEPKVMQVLVCLAEAGDVVSKEKLMSRVWTGTFVTDDVLTRSISELRKVFEDDPKNPQYIQTIPKGGYRLLVHAEYMNPGNGTGHVLSGKPIPREFVPTELGSETHSAADEEKTNKRRARWEFVALAGLVLIVAALSVLFWRKLSSEAPGPGQYRALLAILPFQNLNNDPSQDYFADGLTAEMISQIGRLPSDRLGVIAWNSMMRYKGAKKTDDEVGRELAANYILEGTVRREAEHVRITAELVKVGERNHIWANSYDGDLGDVLAVQGRIAGEIASEIQLRLTPEQQARLNNTAQLNPEGYDAYLRGKAITDSDVKLLDRQVPVHLTLAIRLNPGYAPPYVTLAVYYRNQASFGFAPSKSAYAKARAALEKALQLDPGLASAHRELGCVSWRGDWDDASAEREIRLALELNPGEALTHQERSLFLKSQGRYDEALSEINKCLELSPLEAISHANAGTLLGLMGRDDAAMEQFRKALELDPKEQYVHERSGTVLLWQGKYDQAIQEFQKTAELTNRRPEKLAWLGYAYAVNGERQQTLGLLDEIKRNPRQQYVSPFHVAMLYAGLGDKENALAWLEKAYEEHDEWMVYLKIYPEFASLRSDPRFQDLERRVGLI
jgi:TolB-like protein/DNA-binding winged helix-turn-helix (wHTH) protein/Tfp pilus assembly protein PilF